VAWDATNSPELVTGAAVEPPAAAVVDGWPTVVAGEVAEAVTEPDWLNSVVAVVVAATEATTSTAAGVAGTCSLHVVLTALSADEAEGTGDGWADGADVTTDASPPPTTEACPDADSEPETAGCSADGPVVPGGEVVGGGPNSFDEVLVDGCPNTKPADVVTCGGAEKVATEGLPNSIIPDGAGVVVDTTVSAGVVDSDAEEAVAVTFWSDDPAVVCPSRDVTTDVLITSGATGESNAVTAADADELRERLAGEGSTLPTSPLCVPAAATAASDLAGSL